MNEQTEGEKYLFNIIHDSQNDAIQESVKHFFVVHFKMADENLTIKRQAIENHTY